MSRRLMIAILTATFAVRALAKEGAVTKLDLVPPWRADQVDGLG